MTQQRTEPAPRTAAGRALVEWAHTAFPEQESIWREHALLIEAEAAEQSVPLDVPILIGSWNQHFFDKGEGHYCLPTCLRSILYIYNARLLPSEPSESARPADHPDTCDCLGNDPNNPPLPCPHWPDVHVHEPCTPAAPSAQVRQGSEAALREALGHWITAGCVDEAVDRDLYRTDAVYKAVIHIGRALAATAPTQESFSDLADKMSADYSRAALAASQPTAGEEERS